MPPSVVLEMVARRWGVPPPIAEYFVFVDGSWSHWYAKTIKIMELEAVGAEARQHQADRVYVPK